MFCCFNIILSSLLFHSSNSVWRFFRIRNLWDISQQHNLQTIIGYILNFNGIKNNWRVWTSIQDFGISLHLFHVARFIGDHFEVIVLENAAQVDFELNQCQRHSYAFPWSKAEWQEGVRIPWLVLVQPPLGIEFQRFVIVSVISVNGIDRNDDCRTRFNN